MKTCNRCVSPVTWDTLELDANGTCNICHQHDTKKSIDWSDRKQQLLKIVADAKRGAAERGDTYDCIVPVSGAKDSCFQLLYVVRELGMKPLAVRFDHGLYRPKLEENFRRVTKQLDVDVATFNPSFKVMRELMMVGLLRRGDSCVGCHLGIYAGVMQQVLRWKIPLVFWGEQISEYQAWGNGFGYDEIEEVSETRFYRIASMGLTAEDLEGMVGPSISKRDLDPFRFPELSDLKRLKVKSLCLGSFIPWDAKSQSERIRDELGWTGDTLENRPDQFWYEKSECQMQSVRDWCRWIKRGHSRTTHLANIEIRAGRMTREEGLELEQAYIPRRPASLDHFLEMWQMTEAEFEEIVLRHQVIPHDHRRGGAMTDPPADMDKWDKTPVPWPERPDTRRG